MKRPWVIGLVCAAAVSSLRAAEATSSPQADSASSPQAEERFSSAVRAEDFSAAGLAKLSPGELARLDALVRDHVRASLAASRAPAKGGSVAPARVPLRAEAAATAPREERKPTKAKAPRPTGIAAEPAAIESRLAGDFTGWQGRAVFALENGQRWQLAEPGNYYSPAIARPLVKITPAALGAYWLEIEGVRVKVVPLNPGP